MPSFPIIEEDLVDWEPLSIRFLPKSTFADPESFISDVEKWFEANATKKRSDCELRYWNVSRRDSGEIEAVAELLTKKSLRRLGSHLTKRHPTLDRIVIGIAIEGTPEGLSFDWVLLPAAEVCINGTRHSVDPVAISFTQVTFGQFLEFMEKTGHTPVPDQLEFEGYLVDNFRLTWGKSPKSILHGVTYDDAVAYCQWAQLRLPTEPELHHFFETCVKQGRKLRESGDCWTSTSTATDTFVTRDGPYFMNEFVDPLLDRHRKELHRHHYEKLEAPSFRVARTLEKER